MSVLHIKTFKELHITVICHGNTGKQKANCDNAQMIRQRAMCSFNELSHKVTTYSGKANHARYYRIWLITLIQTTVTPMQWRHSTITFNSGTNIWGLFQQLSATTSTFTLWPHQVDRSKTFVITLVWQHFSVHTMTLILYSSWTSCRSNSVPLG